jgi:dTDP-4-amino-4,6-dideoxygalactose transaminase
MKVPLLDLKSQYQSIKEDVLKVTDEIFESQYFILGPHVEKLEKEIAAYCHVKYSVGVSSGTDALVLSLMAAGIKPDDLVITSPYTFFATAGSIARLGAKPVFVDIHPDTFNLDVSKTEHLLKNLPAEQKKKVKGIIPVHLYGQCAAMDSVMALAREYGLCVIEDAAQAIGAEFGGKRAGSLGDMGCFSFFPSKNLGAFGDGGIVTTDSQDTYERLKILRVHGSKPKYYHKEIGGNFRLDALQAAIVSVKLKKLDEWTLKRQANAELYRRLFEEAGLLDQITLPVEKENRHIYNQFVIMVNAKRDALRDYLGEAGIGTEIYYPVPLHLQECFAYLDYKKGACPISENAAQKSMALPVYPELKDEQIAYVVDTIKAFFQTA